MSRTLLIFSSSFSIFMFDRWIAGPDRRPQLESIVLVEGYIKPAEVKSCTVGDYEIQIKKVGRLFLIVGTETPGNEGKADRFDSQSRFYITMTIISTVRSRFYNRFDNYLDDDYRIDDPTYTIQCLRQLRTSTLNATTISTLAPTGFTTDLAPPCRSSPSSKLPRGCLSVSKRLQGPRRITKRRTLSSLGSGWILGWTTGLWT